MNDLEKTLEEYNNFLRSLKDMLVVLRETKEVQGRMIDQIEASRVQTSDLIQSLNKRGGYIKKLKVNHLEE